MFNFFRKEQSLRQQGERQNRDNHQNNNGPNNNRFKWPLYSVRRKGTLIDENANAAGATVSPTGTGVRSILAQVGSMRLEDAEAEVNFVNKSGLALIIYLKELTK